MRRVTLLTALSGLLATSTLMAAPAVAAKAPAHTRIAAHLAPATALVRSSAVISGTVNPAGGSVVLQRLVGKSWLPLASRKSSKGGAFSFSLRAPKATTTWRLRVARSATKSTRAGISNSLTLHVVPTGYLVAAAAAPVTAPAPVVVTGSVAPKASGAVQLQLLTGASWSTIATARLTSTSTFSVQSSLPAGPAQLRVVKPFTAHVATGTSPSFAVAVQPAVPAPSITTTVLPQARVGQPYVAAITAAGGSGAYTWSASGLPTGLTLSASGVLSGTPVHKGSASFATTVTDAAARTGTVTLTLAVAAPAGRLFSVGWGMAGQLGNGTTTDALTLVPVIGQSAVTSVASQGASALASDADGTVWAWGDNSSGNLGTGNTANSLVPVRTLMLTDITAVAGLTSTGLALRGDGTVWAWGNNSFGQVGDGTAANIRLTPVQVTGLSSVVAIAGGATSSYALRSDGTVWSWGDNSMGQLGDGTTTNHSLPAQVTGLAGITAIAAAQANGYALRSDGVEFSWGDGQFGTLGNGSTMQQASPVQITLAGVTAIAAGEKNGYALSASGIVLAWGNSGNDGLGGSAVSTATPVAVHNLTGVTAISSSGIDAVAQVADGSLWVWGRNIHGELGDNTTTFRTEPVPMIGGTGAIGLGTGSTTNLASYVIAH